MKSHIEIQPSSRSFRFADVKLLLTWVLASSPLVATAAAVISGINKHVEEQKFYALRMMDETGHIPSDGLWRALEHRRLAVGDSGRLSLLQKLSLKEAETGLRHPRVGGIQTNSWTWLGPGNIGGRVRSILIHPILTNILWCGAVEGGVWKTTNSGGSWFPLDDFMANLAVACLAIDPTNPDVIYAGTGENIYSDYPSGSYIPRGAGIFKSTDGGASWARLAATSNVSFNFVMRIAVDPNNGQRLLAATRSGIFRSEDGGATWTRPSAIETLEVAFHPTDSTQCIAAGYNGRAFYSTNGGLNWASSRGLPSPTGTHFGRVELAYSRSSPSTVFASVDNSGGQIYRSTDGGHSYSLRSTGANYLDGAGWWSNAIWADPTSTNILLVGGSSALWRSTNGGATLTMISYYFATPGSPHGDHHIIVSSPTFDGVTDRTVYFGNDGGVYRTKDVYNVSSGSGWENLNNNLGITQFYGGAGHVQTMTIIGGAQDHGTLLYAPHRGPEDWRYMALSDGGFCAADPTDPNYFYGEAQMLQIYRSTNGGDDSSEIFAGLTEAGASSVNFIAPFILDPNNPNTILAGGSSLWRCDNVKASTPSWKVIKTSLGSPISAIAVSEGKSDVIWVAHNNGYVYYATNGTAPSPSWIRRDLGSPSLPKRYCTGIRLDPSNSSRIFIAFGGFTSGNLWKTSDGGATWTDISGNLPPAPVNSVVIAPWNSNILYAGTEVGVYATTDGGANWSTSNDGPANVAVNELFWLGNKLVAVTYGRGMFYALPNDGNADPVDLAVTSGRIIGGNGNGSVDPNECNELELVLKNVGGIGAINLTALLASDTPGVNVVQPLSTYPDLAPGGVGTNRTRFRISTSPAFAGGATIALNLTIPGRTNTAVFTLPNPGNTYAITQTTGASIVPGNTDVGNHSDDSPTPIALPFEFNFYGRNFGGASVSPNGNIQFLSGYEGAGCLPNRLFNYAILAFADDLRTDTPGSGIFTSISGSAPSRVFNIEWRARYLMSGKSLDFEVRLYENRPQFDIVYGQLNGDGSTASVGAQQDTGSAYTNFECLSGGLSSGLQLTFQLHQNSPDGGGPCVSQEALPLIASATLRGSDFTFYFETLPRKNYTVEYKDSLEDPVWRIMQSVPGDGNPKQVDNPVSANLQRFYRLSAE